MASVSDPVIAEFFTANFQRANTFSEAEPWSSQEQPQVLFIGCSDSRVPESAVLTSKPGGIFVHRNIANQVHTDDDNALSVLFHALKTLEIPRVIVVGHTDCGGVRASHRAAREPPVSPLSPTTPLQRWLMPLTALATTLPSTLPYFPPNTPEYDHQLPLLIEENVKAQVINITAIIRALGLPATVRIQGGVYEVKTGQLNYVGQQVDVIGTETEMAV